MSKKLLFSISLILCSIAGSYTYAAPNGQARVYVEKGSVRASKSGVTIVAKNWAIKKRALRTDKRGLYVFLDDMCCEKRAPLYYKCLNCGKIVTGVTGVKKHIAEKGQEHRFFYPYSMDCPD